VVDTGVLAAHSDFGGVQARNAVGLGIASARSNQVVAQ
jgi:hypothetical protein